MTTTNEYIADSLTTLEEYKTPVTVLLSNELVHLLSNQLYQSPIKAIEELVVNSLDADASKCHLHVPYPTQADKQFVVVFDNGIGMSHEGLTDLWSIGRSNKRDFTVESARKRKQIGKFGIGKLAARTIANRLTYISRSEDEILSVTIDFNRFKRSAKGAEDPVTTPVRRIADWRGFVANSKLGEMLSVAAIPSSLTSTGKGRCWTLAILEDFTDKAKKISVESLRWILSTALPLGTGFELFLNGTQIESSKESYTKAAEFELHKLPSNRIANLSEATSEEWSVKNGMLTSQSFPSGVHGSVIVTDRVLPGGKSDDIIRSHGFFVKVRGRLVNETDALFGLPALEHGTFSRMHAEIHADDLDEDLKASREAVEETSRKQKFRSLLKEIFREADSRYDRVKRERDDGSREKKEGERNQVASHLVEYPVADALLGNTTPFVGADADSRWFYLELDPTKTQGGMSRVV